MLAFKVGRVEAKEWLELGHHPGEGNISERSVGVGAADLGPGGVVSIWIGRKVKARTSRNLRAREGDHSGKLAVVVLDIGNECNGMMFKFLRGKLTLLCTPGNQHCFMTFNLDGLSGCSHRVGTKALRCSSKANAWNACSTLAASRLFTKEYSRWCTGRGPTAGIPSAPVSQVLAFVSLVN